MMIKGRPARWHTIPDLVRDKAQAHGAAHFCEIDGRTLSYRDLDEQTDAVAGAFARLGVGPGDRVSSVMFNGIEQLLGWVAANKLGAIWAPLNAGLVGDDLAYCVRDCAPKVLIVDDERWDAVAAAPATDRSDLVVIRCPVRGVAAPDDPGAAGARRFDDLLAGPALVEPADISAKDPGLILYTGGTTGLPKGVLLPHFALVCVGMRYGEAIAATPGDRHYTTLPMFHGGGLGLGIIGPLLNDMTSTIDRRFSARAYWSRVRETKATVIDPIGTIMTVLTQAPPDPADRSHGVRVAFGVTGQIPGWVPKSFAERFGIAIVDIYGQTETGIAMVTMNRIDAPAAAEGTVGHPHGWSEIAILNDDDEPLPTGEVGTIALRPTVPFSFMLGYFNNPGLTLEAFRNLWFRTGDLGSVDATGNLFFVGRQVHWLRRRGENISAYELESIISKHPAVVEVIVVGVPGDLGEEEVKACIIAREPRPSPEDLVAWCASRMAAFKLPRYIDFCDDFPRSVTKREVERAKLKALSNERAWDREASMGRFSSQSVQAPKRP